MFGTCIPCSPETFLGYRIVLPAPPGIDRPTVRDIVLGPKALKELAILRHLAHT